MGYSKEKVLEEITALSADGVGKIEQQRIGEGFSRL